MINSRTMLCACAALTALALARAEGRASPKRAFVIGARAEYALSTRT